MKRITLTGFLASAMMLIIFNVSAQTNVLVNGDFENDQVVGTAPTGWTTTTASTVVSVGLTTGSSQAVQIGTASGALSQTVADLGSEFSFDFYFAVLTPTGDRTFKIVLGADVLTMRVTTGGILQFFDGSSWKTQSLTTTTPAIQFCTDNNANNIIDSGDDIKAYRLKFVFHKWALKGQSYDLYISDVNSSDLNLVVTGLTYFHHAPTTPLANINFYLSTATKPFLIDDVSMIKNQVITFDALTAKLISDSDFELTASSSAGLPVTYTSSNTNVATIIGSTVHIVGAGETDITASSAATSDVTAAADVTRTLTVSVTTGLSLTDNDIKVYVINNKIVVNDLSVPLKIFTVTGAEININNELKPGLYIVKIANQITKVRVQ